MVHWRLGRHVGVRLDAPAVRALLVGHKLLLVLPLGGLGVAAPRTPLRASGGLGRYGTRSTSARKAQDPRGSVESPVAALRPGLPCLPREGGCRCGSSDGQVPSHTHGESEPQRGRDWDPRGVTRPTGPRAAPRGGRQTTGSTCSSRLRWSPWAAAVTTSTTWVSSYG